jgi:hypothetical protein
MYLPDDSIFQEDREVINHSLFEYDVMLFNHIKSDTMTGYNE